MKGRRGSPRARRPLLAFADRGPGGSGEQPAGLLRQLAMTGAPARTWEPKRLSLRLLNIAGRVITSGRQGTLRLPRGWPWNDPLIRGHTRLHPLSA